MQYFEETRKLLGNSLLFYIITVDMEGRFSYINDHYAKEFAYIEKDMVGQPTHITMHPDDMKTCEEVAAKCFANPGKLFPATIRKHDGKGGFVFTQWEYKAMFDEQHNPAGILCLGYDITKYVAEQIQLEEVQGELQKKSAAINQIIFQQSHLMRAPLSNIMGLVSVIDRSQLDANTANICDMLLQSANQLDDVIKSIVDTAGEQRG